jgi:hypothetical protein
MGIGPTQPAWKAGILPLNYTRICYNIYYTKKRIICQHFLQKNIKKYKKIDTDYIQYQFKLLLNLYLKFIPTFCTKFRISIAYKTTSWTYSFNRFFFIFFFCFFNVFNFNFFLFISTIITVRTI